MADKVDSLEISNIINATIEEIIADAAQHPFPKSPSFPTPMKGRPDPLSNGLTGIKNLELKEVAEEADWLEDMGTEEGDWSVDESEYVIADSAEEAKDLGLSELKLEENASEIDDDYVKCERGSHELTQSAVEEKEESPRLSLRDKHERGFYRPEVKNNDCRVHREQQCTPTIEEVEMEDDGLDEDILPPSPREANQDWTPRFQGWNDHEISFEGESTEGSKIYTAYRPKESPNGSADWNRTLGKPYFSPSPARRHANVPENSQLAHTDADRIPRPKPDWYEWDDWYKFSCLKNYLNDGTDIDEAAETLTELSSSLSFHAARTAQRHSSPLEGQLLEQWLHHSIAATEKLIRNGNGALASKASEIVRRVLMEASAAKGKKVYGKIAIGRGRELA
ncbi:hypothetical protein MMC28_010810 [Mycoblastus sanguinarius]|nr:hypothetical protein [Mycoblastus sanguinarius]